MDEDTFERKLYVVRKLAERRWPSRISKTSTFLSSVALGRTIVYKGLLLAPQIANFYGELSDPDVMSALCLVHQRFSTNTFPSWQLAHPYRYIAHNGEINTLKGNVNWMHARQSVLESPLFGDDSEEAISDDCAGGKRLGEFRQRGGAAVPGRAPAARDGHADSRGVGGESAHEDGKRAFYEYHASLMEPWDGPAAIGFTDGRVIGATLDRNGLRPGRYVVTNDDLGGHGFGSGRAGH